MNTTGRIRTVEPDVSVPFKDLTFSTEDMLGEGSFSTVYRARSKTFGDVAFKYYKYCITNPTLTNALQIEDEKR
jgi:hypothetical protein